MERYRECLLLLVKFGLSAPAATGVSPFRPSGRSLLRSKIALKLGACHKRMECELAYGGCRVDVLLEATKANASIVEVLDRLAEMFEASTDPVNLPNHEGIAFAKQRKYQLQLRPISVGSACHLSKEAVDACSVKRLPLKVKTLSGGCYPGVSDELAQFPSSSMPSDSSACGNTRTSSRRIAGK